MPTAEEVVLPYVVARHARVEPGRTCAVFEGGELWTWSDALEQAARAASALDGFGVGRGEPVLVLLENGADWLRAWWGIAAVGATLVPIHTAYRGDGLRHACKVTGARFVVSEGELAGRLAQAGVPLTVVEASALALGDMRLPALDPPIEPWDLHTVNYTSGTTGPAKGVLTPWLQTYMGGSDIFGAGAGLSRDDRWLVDLPLFHVAAQQITLAAVSAGASIAVRSAFNGRAYWRTAREAGVTRSLLAGTMGAFLLAQDPSADDRSHQLEVVVAAPVPEPQEFLERFGLREIHTAFGSTETGSPILVTGDRGFPLGSCGRARPGLELRLVDEHDLPVAEGAAGELIIRSEIPWELNLGYLDDADATARAWRNGWFHTGDLFRRDDQGWYYFSDRLRDSLRRRGENISSFEVEREVMAYPGVAEAACVGVAGELGDDEIKVFVVPTSAEAFDEAELIEFLAARLAHFMVPRFVERVDQLPRTATMRVKKFELRSRPPSSATWDREAAGIRVTRRGLERFDKRD